MGRWEPDAVGRLQQAAMALFRERGYSEVTVAEIADRAGLTKRTFFNHFADKREVLFAGAEAFEASVVKHLAESGDDLDPVEAAVVALTHGGLGLSGYSDFARARQELIASSPELQERDLIKMASLASAIAGVLRQRHVPARIATLSAHAAVAVFTTAYGDWVDDVTADFSALMQRSLGEMRQAVAAREAPMTSGKRRRAQPGRSEPDSLERAEVGRLLSGTAGVNVPDRPALRPSHASQARKVRGTLRDQSH